MEHPREDGTIVYHLSVAEGDMGRVIGKHRVKYVEKHYGEGDGNGKNVTV